VTRENDVETFREIVIRVLIGKGCQIKKLQRSSVSPEIMIDGCM
jgi:hypothetical protein